MELNSHKHQTKLMLIFLFPTTTLKANPRFLGSHSAPFLGNSVAYCGGRQKGPNAMRTGRLTVKSAGKKHQSP